VSGAANPGAQPKGGKVDALNKNKSVFCAEQILNY